MAKHAFLIMAHNRIDVLQELVDCIDNSDVDIYIHLDKKFKEQFCVKSKKSNIFLLKRSDVRWAGYSQIQCELALLDAAISSGNKYIYYHFISGTTFPLKPIDYICKWFDSHFPSEFVGFDEDNNRIDRVKYIFLFNEIGKPKTNVDHVKVRLRQFFLRIQMKIGINRFKKFNMVFKKGISYFSITHECATYILSKKKLIRKMLKHSISGDEVFIQTLVYNSPFKNRIYSFDDEYDGSQVVACWPKFTGEDRGENTSFKYSDYDLLINSNKLFAYKFDAPDSISLIRKIKETF